MKGILFTEPMFNSTIEGRKTQTRRIVKSQSVKFEGNIFQHADYYVPVKPCYKAGQAVYIKEPFVRTNHTIYKYSQDENTRNKLKDDWKNPRTMPARYARYFIKITAVRCERLQDISDADCLKEGIMYDGCSTNDNNAITQKWYKNGITDKCGKQYHYKSPKTAYADLINKINGKNTWENNPYVWVYDFELINN